MKKYPTPPIPQKSNRIPLSEIKVPSTNTYKKLIPTNLTKKYTTLQPVNFSHLNSNLLSVQNENFDRKTENFPNITLPNYFEHDIPVLDADDVERVLF